jgi:hypothetical protein
MDWSITIVPDMPQTKANAFIYLFIVKALVVHGQTMLFLNVGN